MRCFDLCYGGLAARQADEGLTFEHVDEAFVRGRTIRVGTLLLKRRGREDLRSWVALGARVEIPLIPLFSKGDTCCIECR